MNVDDVLPDVTILATALGVVVLAVVLWAVISFARGAVIRPLEAVMFALVFAVVYFGSLSLLEDDGDQSGADSE
ncbi:hypothetical protein GRX03_14625 [Halovenus sp. WSH3]|uniref:Uncharacterized protein n=1 Tax=Halovenus carboxidivorans TaxID=2692199 RepID=A0A6B0T9B6_9EURY|nr:hypothetical protein [Halovenus carboxidivorans]MXR52836.1 hypothetical protein [Halovenus carboxidivorans]